MSKPAFTLAVIGRDSLSLLRECFEAALAGAPAPAEILYVDDCSSDGSAAWVSAAGMAARMPRRIHHVAYVLRR